MLESLFISLTSWPLTVVSHDRLVFSARIQGRKWWLPIAPKFYIWFKSAAILKWSLFGNDSDRTYLSQLYSSGPINFNS